ncbi:MAG: class I SAM-dependent methyltransferase [Chloroflexales bacterium]|nr:class I SAM-dependent methyltransferase [Chloroflexales bacterium]
MSDANLQRQITTYWDARGKSYDTSVGHSLRDEAEREIWLQLLREQLPLPPAHVLDVGTGTGFLAVLLSEVGHRVVGVDLSDGMLALAKEKCAGLALPPKLLVGDAHAPPGEPGSFDVVISRHLLWTLSDPLRALRNWLRLLRPGGLLIVIDGLWWAGGVNPADTDAMKPWHELWKMHYSAEVQVALPLMHAQTLEPIEALTHEAGLVDVTVVRLAALEQLERSRGSSSCEPQPRFLLCGRRSDAGDAS